MKKAWKNVLALTLSLAMTLSLGILPAAALEENGSENVAEIEGGNPYTTLAAAIAAAGSGQTVKLLSGVAESVTVPEGKTLTLDLNGCTLTNTANSHTISNYGTLIIEDGAGGGGTVTNATSSCGALANYEDGTVTLESGKLTRADDTTWYPVKNLGVMTIAGGEVSANLTASSLIANGWYGASGNDLQTTHTGDGLAKLTIAGGTFSGGMNTVKNDDWGKLEITAGNFSNTSGPVIQNWNIATIGGGTFNANFKRLIANGYCDPRGDQGLLTITGGTFNAFQDEDSVLFGYNEGDASGGKLSIEGGTFIGDLGNLAGYKYATEITGGTFSTDLPEACLAAGYSTKQENGKYVVQGPVASVGEKNYATLSAAITDAASGETIALLKDVDTAGGTAAMTMMVPAGKTLTIDGQNHKIAGDGITSNGEKNALFLVEGNLNLKDLAITNVGIGVRMKGDGSVVNADNVDITAKYYGCAVRNANQKLTIQKSKLTGWAGIMTSAGDLTGAVDSNSTIDVENSTINCNILSNEWYGAIVLQEKFHKVAVTVKNTTINLKGEPKQSADTFAFDMRAYDSSIIATNVNVVYDAKTMSSPSGIFGVSKSKNETKSPSPSRIEFSGTIVAPKGTPMVNFLNDSDNVGVTTFRTGDTVLINGTYYAPNESGAAVASAYVVTFDSNGGSAVPSSTVAQGAAIVRPASPTRSGYNFAGWYTDAGFTQAYNFTAPVVGPTTLYANWAVPSTGGTGTGSTGTGDRDRSDSDSSSSSTPSTPGTSTDTKTDGSVTTETTTKTETTSDGSKVTETTETAKDTATGATTETVTTETVAKDGTKTTEQTATETKSDGATAETKVTETVATDGSTVKEETKVETAADGVTTETIKTETVDAATGVAATTEVVKTDVGSVATASVAATAQATTEGDKSTATVTPEAASKLVEQAVAAAETAKQAGADAVNTTVTIAFEAPKDAKSVEMDLSAATLSALADAGANVTLAYGEASVTLDPTAAKSLASVEGDAVAISVSVVDNTTLPQAMQDALPDANAIVLDLSATSNESTVSDFGGGTVTISVHYVPKDPGKAVVVYNVLDDGTMVKMNATYNAVTGTLDMITSHFSYYAVMEEDVSFTDVADDAWYAAAVKSCVVKGLFSGTSDTAFSPDAGMTRGMLATVLHRMAGKPAAVGKAFTDVEHGVWYADAVAWASANGIMDGYGAGQFGVNDPVTREQLVAVLYRYAKSPAVTGADLSGFTDAADVSGFAASAMQWAVQTGVVSGAGDGTVLSPKSGATRAEVAVLLERFGAKFIG